MFLDYTATMEQEHQPWSDADVEKFKSFKIETEEVEVPNRPLNRFQVMLANRDKLKFMRQFIGKKQARLWFGIEFSEFMTEAEIAKLPPTRKVKMIKIAPRSKDTPTS